jgi:hypothetical protein
MKKIILIVVFFTSTIAVNSQSVEDFKLEGSQIVNDYTIVENALENRYYGYTNNYNSWYNQIADIASRQTNRDNRTTLTIPVVVHIVWNGSDENIAQYYVTEQIRVLNETFKRSNSDTSNMRSVFQPIAGNPNIEFYLVSTERVQTNATFTLNNFTLYDDVKHLSSGGSNALNTTSFLNIWVAKLQPDQQSGGVILGYAYPPAGAPNWGNASSAFDPTDDGIVIDYRAFKTFGSYLNSPMRGKTTVHEVGHYLGLRHIWGDGNCSQDDGLADTPAAGSQTPQNCDVLRNTCNQGTGDMPDMVENFMDYSSETCQNSFTKDQSNMMRTVLQNYRSGLLLSASVDELDNHAVSLYPNPSNGIVNYTLNNNLIGASIITLYTVSGIVVEKYYVNNKIGSVDLSSLDNGVYIFSLNNQNKVFNKRIVLKN